MPNLMPQCYNNERRRGQTSHGFNGYIRGGSQGDSGGSGRQGVAGGTKPVARERGDRLN